MDEPIALAALGALAQPTRLAAFRRLLTAHPASLQAGEIAKACEVPHNTMSTHLGVLTDGGLLRVERDGRTMNYRVDLDAFRGLVLFLTRDCCNGRPDLCGDIARLVPAAAPEPHLMRPAFNVLFLCTHNSARSLMAEALLRQIGKGRFNAYSAGSDPARLPVAEVLERLERFGHAITELRCKSWHEFTGPTAPRMDFVITLCDAPQGQQCPDLGDEFVTAEWPLPDPADFKGAPAERAALIAELYGMIRRRIEIFTSLPFATLDRLALKARLDEIGDAALHGPQH
jgi:ArsR family transcriptional regulator, arsenate/arsenite/antimonite-responsive transcriptional repressor / arsenate reductase (thioredoxin)